MTKIIWTIIALCSFSICGYADEWTTIRQQFAECGYYELPLVDEAVVKTYLAEIRSDGTWLDIDYANKRRASWKTLLHLKRLVSMGTAYQNPASAYYRSAEMKDALINGLAYWAEHDFSNPNWWHMKIGAPANMLKAMLLLGDDLPPALYQQARGKTLSRTKIGMTGQNKVWVSGVVLMRALLDEDPVAMKAASESIWAELQVTTQEGIQPDWSFHQHGPQLQFGNYGRSFGGCMAMWGAVLRGTSYAMPPEKVESFSHYLTDGPAWVLWQDRMDFSGCGRQFDKESVGDPDRNFVDISRQLKLLTLFNPACKEKVARSLARPNQLIGHSSYWRSDFAVHRRPDWYASVKMSSKRVVGTEVANSENSMGLHNGDGVLMAYRTGYEYEEIQPVWDWHRLPGTTCDQGLKKLRPKGYKHDYGGSEFAGVLNDGSSGVAAMVYQRNRLSAKKAWFFNEDSIVCLGAGIGGETIGPVYTSVQQSLLQGAVQTAAGELKAGEQALPSGSWVLHAGFGYQLLDAATVKIETVDGNWQRPDPQFSDRPVTDEVFSIWINHGSSPVQQSYAYVVYPQTSAAELAAGAQAPEIIANTVTVQAVATPDGLAAVFYEPGRVVSGALTLEAAQPCMVQLKKDRLIVCDPTQSLNVLQLNVNGKTVEINLPGGAKTGCPVEKKCSFMLAPLAKSAGGTERCGRAVFKDQTDPDYQKLLRAFDPIHERV